MPSATPTPAFNPAAVRIEEHKVDVTPLYVVAGPDNSAYFGYGANGTGSNLLRYNNGSIMQTQPAAPPSGFDPGGGVYGITVTTAGRVFWLSAYLDSSFSLFVNVECGGAGGTAGICEPTVDEPTSMLVDASGTFWVGGLSLNGGGEIATSRNASTSFNTTSVMQLLNGPGGRVWGVLADFTASPTQYSIAEFRAAGSSISMTSDFQLPSGDGITSMTLGGDGALWFADDQRNAIGRMTATGSLQEFPLRAAKALGPFWYGQVQIATACDGAVWFTEPGPNMVARLDMTGKLNEFPLPTGDALPGPITARPGRHPCTGPELWLGEQNTNILAGVSY